MIRFSLTQSVGIGLKTSFLKSSDIQNIYNAARLGRAQKTLLYEVIWGASTVLTTHQQDLSNSLIIFKQLL